MKDPVARVIIVAMANIEKAKENLNLFSTFGTSMKKFENSASFEVAPHVCKVELVLQYLLIG